ncbi:hypothetical protein B0T17DRAFT_502133 [Bombardia bombarda]|uniref:Uncharacterized protein n=1 Tax=Bombardia bombarda TaxID=252184 RepID=A0AA40CDI5_9PEZI|nr:hypothetical protein B0T17DRAFT_502133 [Bombardia bombarda]
MLENRPRKEESDSNKGCKCGGFALCFWNKRVPGWSAATLSLSCPRQVPDGFSYLCCHLAVGAPPSYPHVQVALDRKCWAQRVSRDRGQTALHEAPGLHYSVQGQGWVPKLQGYGTVQVFPECLGNAKCGS